MGGTAWPIVERAATMALRRFQQSRRLDPNDAHDLIQDFWLHVIANQEAIFRTFRGTTDAELGRFTWVLADRFARRWHWRVRRRRAREAEALRGCPAPEREGPVEARVALAIHELNTLLSDEDRARLRCVREHLDAADVTDRSPGVPRSTRTYRRWREELYRRYGDRIL
ncbi:hypothetical protein AB1L88_00010 [Tautonia sp. JC769]|uniref:hypothetical protein n=1 Tax=Tautonia sp. JC769 TaxID=3232135 RepID=UPI003458FE16